MKKIFLFLALAIVGNIAMQAQGNLMCKDNNETLDAKVRHRAPQKVESQYGLFIGGTEVTSSNKSNIPLSGKTKGTISYNSSTNTLTLNGVEATFVTSGFCHFIQADNDLTIQVEGNNKIVQIGDGQIKLGVNNTIIQGTGTLEYDNYMDGKGTYTGIHSEYSNSKLTIQGGVTVIINAGYYGIANMDLVIDHSTLIVQNDKEKPLLLTSLTINGCNIYTPGGATFENGYVTVNGKNFTGRIVIAPNLQQEDYYGITIGGVEVHKYNASDVLADGTVKVTKQTSGTYKYNIFLMGVKYTKSGGKFIQTDEDVRLYVNGENQPNEIASGLYFGGNVEVLSDGLLDINSEDFGIRFQKNLIFYNNSTRIRIKAKNIGLAGVGSNAYCELNGVMEITGNGAAENATYVVHQVSGKYTAVLTKGTINQSQGRIDDGSSVAKTVKVLPTGWNIFVDDYNTQITKDNYTDILGNGRLTYNPITATLTMKNCTIQSTTGDGLTAYQCFRLKLEGNNVIEGVDYALDVDDNSVWVEGPGSLVARATGVNGYGMYGASPLRVFGGARLEAYGEYCAISCVGEDLEVDSAIVKAKGDEYSIGGVKNLKLRKAEIISNHTWDISQHKFLNAAGNEANDTIVISNDYYPIRIEGRLLTSQNAGNISFTGKASGSMSYDKASHTLVMNNVQGNYMQSMPLIETSENNLKLIVSGTNNILLTKAIFMRLSTSSGGSGNVTIQGGGTLTVSNLGANTYGICGNSIKLQGNTTLNVQSDNYAINGYFHIDNSTADLTGNGYDGAIYSLSSVNNCHIESPDSIVSSSYGLINIYTGKNVYPKHLVLKPGETQEQAQVYCIRFYDGIESSYYYVTDSTCANITFPSLKQGTISYDTTANVLTLNNAYIDTLTYVLVGESNATIELVGENTIIYRPTSGGNYALRMDSKDTIQGSGSLHLVGSLACVWDIVIRNTSISVQDGRLYVWTEDVVIENSNVEITAKKGESAVYGVKSLTLTDCEIVDPVGATYDATAKTVLLDGNPVSHLRIESTKTGIEEITQTEDNKHNVRKIMHNGTIYILRDGKIFNILGATIQ